MEAQHCLSVVVGCPLFLRQLPSGPCLILDADRSSLENLCSAHQLSEHPWPVAFQQVALSDVSGETLSWKRFSDNRFNGPWQPSDFHHDYPNLQEVETVDFQGQTLADVLEKQPFLQDYGSKFALIITQGDPLRALKGAEIWLHRCTSIVLRCIDIPSGIFSACVSFLSIKGFSPFEEDNVSIWIPQVAEVNAAYLLKLEDSLSVLLDKFSYKVLYPGLNNMSTEEVLAHWIAMPHVENIASKLLDIQKRFPRQFSEISEGDVSLEALYTLFPFQFYRSVRSDLAHLDNRQLLEYFCTVGLKEGLYPQDGVGIQFSVRALHDDPCLKALNALFPYQFYRSLRPDLAHFDDRQLLEHFCTSGLKEGIRLEDGVEMQFAIRALRHVFPYSLYRTLRPDLASLTDQSLLLYFCRENLESEIDLSEKAVKNFSGSFPISEAEILKERIKELEKYLDASRKQIADLRESMIDVFENNSQ